MKISVLGCGWLGFPLALHLVESGHIVKGSTTSASKIKQLKQAGIDPYCFKIPDNFEKKENQEFWDSEILILNIPPGRGSNNVKMYPQLIKSIADLVDSSPIKWIIFASSTSVYPENGGICTETDAETKNTSRPSGEAVLKAENLLREYDSFDLTVLRFGGLYGYGRHPVHYLAGKKDLNEPEKPVNLIHQDDCINIITEIIKQQKKNTIYNSVSDGHPPRRAFYQSAAEHFGLDKPEFRDDVPSSNRVASNEKLKDELGYTFIYPNPMDHTP